MGWSLSWLAFRDISRETILNLLNLRSTGTRDSVSHGRIGYLEIPNGWKLILFDHKEFGDKELNLLSHRNDLVYCFVEEHVMFSKAAAWAAGNEVWSVIHASEVGISDLQIKGSPPAIFERIRTAQFAEQKKEEESSEQVDHIFEIPVLLAQEVTGFRYDQDIPGVWEDEAEILEAAKRPFLNRLFGASN
jgi:hypothetical protein